MIRTKAKQFAENSEIQVPSDFKFSNGWLQRMKDRANIKSFVKHGEAATVTEADAQLGRQAVLAGKKSDYYCNNLVKNISERNIIF